MTPRSRATIAFVGLAALGVLRGSVACSTGEDSTDQAPDGATTSPTPPPVSADPVLLGRWELLFSGLPFDYPNFDPWVDAREGAAHVVYRSKTGQLRYFVFEAPASVDGGAEATFPQGTKGMGRVVALPSGESVVFGVDQVSGQVSSYRRTPGATVVEPGPPLDPARGRVPFTFESAELGGDAVFAGVVAKPLADGGPGPLVAVDRLGGSTFRALGEFPASDTVTRIRLASQGETLVLAIYAGSTTRSVHAYRDGAWRELEGLPRPGDAVGAPSLVVDGGHVFLLEYDLATSTSVVWLHDGTTWTPFARSQPSEGLRSLTLHDGALYALYGDVPNKGLPVTRGIARIDRDLVTRAPFDGQSPSANIDADSRHDLMSQEECRLVSRGKVLLLTYAEGSTATQTIRLYRHVGR